MSEGHGLGDVTPTVARVPNLFLLDTSGSMNQEVADEDGTKRPKIDQLNDGLKYFQEEIEENFQAEKAVDVSLITFGGDVTVEQEFTPIEDWTPPKLAASGNTPMCDAIVRGANHLEDRKDAIDEEDLPRKRGLVWLLTDGRPDNRDGESWEKALSVIEGGTREDALFFYAVGIGEEADMSVLEELTDAADDDSDSMAFQLGDGMFKEFFRIASDSAKAQSEGADSEAADDVMDEAMIQQDPDNS